MQNKKGNVVVIAIIVAIVAITAGVIGFLLAKKTQAPAAEPAVTQPVAQTPVVQPADETADWKTYTNTQYGFEFKYPIAWEVKSVSPSDMGGEWFSINPKETNNSNKNLVYHVAIFKSQNDPENWYKNTIEDPDKIPNNKGGAEKLKINGYTAYHVNNIRDSYVDQIYVISNKGIISYFIFREVEVSVSKAGGEYSYANYLPEFKYLINSIKFSN